MEVLLADVMRRVRIAAVIAAIACAFGNPAAEAASKAHHHLNAKAYAYLLAKQRGWASQWWAINEIVTPESGWNPCAYNPSHSDCHYRGTSSCGIPQAQPCPSAWRGRLWTTRYAQVRWLMDYIHRRYGSPLGALAFRRVHHWY